MKQKTKLHILFLIPFSILLSSWGWVGHQRISSSIVNSFIEEMELFEDWLPYLKDHASDADYRKGSDPSEGPKHYIDIDAYPEFVSTGKISTSLDSCIAKHGSVFVDRQGYLPWVTMDTYSLLVEMMQEGDWIAAKTAAADLGHYVADGFMPMHLTKNYNGQYSDNEGIHSRYESGMIGDYQDEILYDGAPVEDIDDIKAYIFEYIYYNYQFVDDILAADNIAKSVDESYGNVYTNTLWEESSDFTIALFQGASQAFANLFYNAWKEAGQPALDQTMLYISEGSAYLPGNIGVTYGKTGVVYVVPVGTEKDLAMVRSACLDSLNTKANIEIKIPLEGLANGNYYLYARDYTGKLSGPVSFSVSNTTGLIGALKESLAVYPNPSAHRTYFDFFLARNATVSVKVVDLNGALVEIIHSGEMQTGSHQLVWQHDHLSPGVYFVNFVAGDGILVERLLKR